MKIGILGVGNIGDLFLQRLLEEDGDNCYYIFDPEKEKTKKYHSDERVTVCKTEENVINNSEVIIPCVKPQYAENVLIKFKSSQNKDALIISPITGFNIHKIKHVSGMNKIITIMPNLPAYVGDGLTLYCLSDDINKNDLEIMKKILSSLGKFTQIKERDFPAVTALCGSNPAFIFVIIESMIDAGIKMGFSYEKSKEMVLQTIIGSAKLIKKTGMHPGIAKNTVTSPAGTTIEGIYFMEKNGLRGTILEALITTYDKAKEFYDTYKE